MYNSSIKGQGEKIRFEKHIEIPDKVFFNDMSKNYYVECFSKCDVIFSEIAWIYGYPLFNDNAGNTPNPYKEYLGNIVRLIHTMQVPAFIVCGKNVKTVFNDAEMHDITINNSGTRMNNCTLYTWNYEYDPQMGFGTKQLINYLSERFNCCLDFSCGYGEHLLGFKDFIGCDINRDCLTYLSILVEERKVRDGGKTTA